MKATFELRQGKAAARVSGWTAIAFGVVAAFFMHGSAHAASHVSDVDGPIEISDPQDPNAVLEYWTDERMESTLISENTPPGFPDEPPLLPGADDFGYVLMPMPYTEDEVSRINGILFYRRPNGQDGHCSASVIASHSRSLILTAAHCVSGTGGWGDMLMFVPAYNGDMDLPTEEQAPLGKWPIKQAFTPPVTGAGDEDIAVASIYPQSGQLLQDVVGDAFQPLVTQPGAGFESLDLYGYPGLAPYEDPPYHGEQRHCRSPAIQRDQTTMLDLPHCAAQDGNSGGPIVIEGSSGFTGFVVGVVYQAHGYTRLLPWTFQPIYDAADAARNP